MKDELCGHVNRHSAGVDGLPDNMECFLLKGHEGLHRGKHMTRFVTHKVEKKKIVAELETLRETESEWSDGASIPVSAIPVVEIKPKTLAEQEFGDFAKTVLAG